ncbi:MAG: M4 family metallopeptidase, partial [Nocardioides sp.]|nr:M4 family metallopeptidase [Nocardioides sp.]
MRQDETGKVGFIGAPAGRPIDVGMPVGSSSGTVAKAFLRQNAAMLGLAGSQTTLEVAEQHRSVAGGQSVRVSQVHAGIPVFGGEFTVNLDTNQDVLSVLGEASPIGKGVATEPLVGTRAAAEAAVAKVARAAKVAPGRLAASEPELTFYDPRLLGAAGPFQTARLSWVMEVRSAKPAVAHTVVVDAASGTVALSFSTIAHARDRIVCDANNTATQYPCAAPVWTESSQPGGADPDVAAAFEYAGDTYDFFATRMGRDSLDGAGMQLVSTADYCPAGDPCPYPNAFWDGAQMVYGDGFAVADDVVGHELAHGVTDFSRSLFYYMQSGAINESMSDIFGELIDLTNGAGNDTAGVRWLMGEDIPGIGAIRDMENPPAFGDPDRMNSPNYAGGSGDGGGVHTNSGVSNKATYLLVDGATFNGHTVNPLGIDKTALLFYAVNNDLLVSGSDFADLANAMRQACTTLAGAGTGGYTTADCTKVQEAILATEMDLNPTAAPTDIVAQCPTVGTTAAYAYHDDLETPAGQFTTTTITGSEVWSYPQNPNDYAGYDATYATSGDTNIWGDNPTVLSDSALRMTSPVAVPTNAYLYFNHAYGLEPTFDGGVLEYSTGGPGGPWTDAGSLLAAAGGYDGTISSSWGNPLGGRSAFTGRSSGYGASRADLSTLAGQSVMFRWRIGTDTSVGDYGWFIDDVSVYTCVTDTTPPDTTITSGPADGSTVPTSTATFGFSATEAGSTFECKLDAGAYGSCTSPKAYTGLADGSHTFSVRATDAAANTDPSSATRTFTVAAPDTTAPNTKITKHPQKQTFMRIAKFAFKSSELGSRFKCKVDRTPWKTCTSPYKVKVRPGTHKFRVRAIDAAG